STSSEPGTGPVVVTVETKIHASADVQTAPEDRPQIAKIQSAEGVADGLVVEMERRREVPTERAETEKAVQEERPRAVLKEMQLVRQKDKTVKYQWGKLRASFLDEAEF